MLTYLPTIPDSSIIEYQTTINYSALNAAALTFRLLVVGIPANYVVCGVGLRVLTSFAGPNLQSITASVGGFVPNSSFADIDFYLGALELTQVVTPQAFELSGPPNNNLNLSSSGYTQFYASPLALFYNDAHDVSAYFVAQGANVNTLSAGAVEVTVQIRSV